jgi:hypothetical protein
MAFCCRVCGLLGRYDTYEENIICFCCRAQTTLDDYDLETVRAYRAEWIKNGCPWISDKKYMARYGLSVNTYKPIEQMENIPPEWR